MPAKQTNSTVMGISNMRSKKSPKKNKQGNLYQDMPMLPTSLKEVQQRGWDSVDIILVTADAYVDHPSFGVALIGRWLESLGFRVAILAQPDWRSADDFKMYGPPRLFWGITSGAVDSRLNNYSSFGNRRKEDVYSPGGKTGLRPDRPILAYASRAREAFKGIPIILGGLEASLRRLTHYDYIEDQLKRSVLIDAKADMLVFGMAERAIGHVAKRLDKGEKITDLTDIPGTAWPTTHGRSEPSNAVSLPSLADQQEKPAMVMKAQISYQREFQTYSCPVTQDQGAGSVVVLPPAEPLTTNEMDTLYGLPFARQYPKRYDKEGGIPALTPIQFSITSHRGCFGGCSFCSLYFHQGKHISFRSIDSLLGEADTFLKHKDFRGTISDIGGPTANMYGMKCLKDKPCHRMSCIAPSPCKYLGASDDKLLKMLRAFLSWARKCPRKINLQIASGVRHDLALLGNNSQYISKKTKSTEYTDLLAANFVSGHLKMAPEHYCADVLKLMGKTPFNLFETFEKHFEQASAKVDKKQYIVPYFITGHPGCTVENSLELCQYLFERNWQVRQVQDFTPIPLSLSAAMYQSGQDSQGKTIHVARGRKEKQLQMALLKYHEPRSQKIISTWLGELGPSKINSKYAKLLTRLLNRPGNNPKVQKRNRNDNKRTRR